MINSIGNMCRNDIITEWVREFTKYEVVGSFLVVRAKQKQRAVCLLREEFLIEN